MESLKKLGEVCRNHYEKMVLIVALILLGAAVWYLNDVSNKEAAKFDEYLKELDRRGNTKVVPPADVAVYQEAERALKNPPVVNFSLPHNVFNPVKWQRAPDNSVIKIETGKEIGVERMMLMNTTPLNFIVAFARIASPGAYFIDVTREAAERPVDRKTRQKFVTLNATNELFGLVEIKGAPEEPSELVVQLNETKERVNISKDKPFTRVEGYEADLKYSVDGKAFNKQRVGGTIHFAGEDYKIVAITRDEVVLLSGNGKKYSVRRSAAQ